MRSFDFTGWLVRTGVWYSASSVRFICLGLFLVLAHDNALTFVQYH